MKPHLVICEVCGKPKGRWFNHTECSKIKQSQHEHDKRKKSHTKYTDSRIAKFAKFLGE
jgi:hypothetical protein